ncbi:carbonic anhydrase [Aliarcobacter lanthieri]|uniref:carbonic anhydrase n=1 Tax=Aliarcobacter lanthieri TaxID=1355374 RepID=UPI00192234C9|nr:carbonic anhydrase [Aliarcobacter lanthieri]MBL3520395.1 carbonic anhydrase [Aliarcobacter lanthieri]
MQINDLIKGNKKFREARFSEYETDLKQLVKTGQKPEILFIGCSDSRVTPDLMLDTKPGDLFILRNVGNFVPPYNPDNDYHGTSAAIEYAVNVLHVKHIIVCGHSHCGACKSLYQDLENSPELTNVKKWLELGKKAKEYTLLAAPNKEDKEHIYRTTEKVSIVYQMENLLSFPYIVEKIKNSELQIHGWYYRIEDGTIEYYDGIDCTFKPLEDYKK